MCLTTSNPELPLSGKEKTLGGILMIVGIISSMLVILMHWPDKMHNAGNNVYSYKLFKITLIENNKEDSEQLKARSEAAEQRLKEDLEKASKLAQVKKEAGEAKDSAALIKATKEKDSADIIVIGDKRAVEKANKDKAEKKECESKLLPESCNAATIQFGTLILILVAASGFLGNMVYVASSFTAFVGAEKFKRSWIMWYCVKPFTASGLAVFLYLALNRSNEPVPINLNGILAGAALAGLFTNIATQKLKEIFIAAFKPNDNLPDKLDAGKQKIDKTSIQPGKIDVNHINNFLITGENLDRKNIVVSINGTKIDPTAISVNPSLIKFSYEVDEQHRDLTEFTLLITTVKGTELCREIIRVI